ncbi:E3 ubiquitin-protein ligase SspH2 [Izhakiella capsodis]|uniref:E3 ubiquitin-protein ligase SspH2 n=1 Tax=Izhakiella capsodis TaxID=1367852 RepID=A0A1I4XXT2_9GAMM|nr:E3 ubiquitin-protein ligase SspH2 [Izhakiella capsodis]
MPLQVGNGDSRAAISSRHHITPTACPDTPPEISVWEKIEAFFCSTNKPEVLALIRQICHPPAGTTREAMAGRFEQLRTLAYGGFEENIQSGRHEENHFCILDENSREMLSVTLDEAGKYTVTCQGHDKTHTLHTDTARAEDCAEQAEGAYGTLRAEHTAATTAPLTAEDDEAAWSAWERAAPTGEATDRAQVVQILRKIQNSDLNVLNL